ncbi:MAG: regulatory protein RecX [Zetaproteobacteria bacterium]|nr:regulatory protein RecX [Zetaproteobacteria bacterium]
MALSINDLDVRQALAYALRLLSVREHCQHEMVRKLRQHEYAHEVITQVLDYLVSNDCLSEARYAESFMRMRLQRGDTPWLAAQKMRERGCQEQVIVQALQAVVESFDSLSACWTCLQKRDPSSQYRSNEKIWRRHVRYLMSKGFSYAVVQEAMKQREKEGL